MGQAPRHGPGWVLPRFLLFYAAVFAGFGAASPFLPALLQERGLSPEALGVALAAGTAIRLLTGPIGGRWADAAGAPRLVLAGFVAASAAVALGYGPAHGLPLLAAVSVGHAAVLAPIIPVADALTVQAADGSAGGGRFRYGWVRGAGSLAFVAAALLSGQVVGLFGLGAIVPLNAGLLAVAAVVALGLPGGARRPAGTRAPVSGLLRVPGFLLLMGIAALIGGSHAMHDGFEVIRWQAAGMSAQAASLLWSASVLSEVFVFLVLGPRLLARFGPAPALALSAVAGVVRWGAAALTASVPVMAVVEPLHGLTFALMHLACVGAIGRTVPAGLAATAQAFYGTVAMGLSGAAVTLGSGPLYGWLGAPAFWAMALLCAAALPLVAVLRLSGPSAPFRPAEGRRRPPGSS